MKWKPSVKTCGLAFWDILFSLLCLFLCLYYDYMQGGWTKPGWFQPYRLVKLLIFFLLEYPAGPRSKVTHWKQTVLYLEDVLTICEGETLVGTMTVNQNKKNPRDVDIMLKYSLNGRRCSVSKIQNYKMR